MSRNGKILRFKIFRSKLPWLKSLDQYSHGDTNMNISVLHGTVLLLRKEQIDLHAFAALKILFFVGSYKKCSVGREVYLSLFFLPSNLIKLEYIHCSTK